MMNNTTLILKTAAVNLLCVLSVFVTHAHAGAPNTNAANSVTYEIGQGWTTHYFDEATQTRWLKFSEVGGHSYCIEAVQGPVSPIQLNPNLAVFSDAMGTTTLNSIAGAPLTNGSRLCYISPMPTFDATTIRSVRLNVPIATASADAGYIRLRIVDTTLVALYPTQHNNVATLINRASIPSTFRMTCAILSPPLSNGLPVQHSMDGSIDAYQSKQAQMSTNYSPEIYGKPCSMYIAYSSAPGMLNVYIGGELLKPAM
jgi:hypothetical protein